MDPCGRCGSTKPGRRRVGLCPLCYAADLAAGRRVLRVVRGPALERIAEFSDLGEVPQHAPGLGPCRLWTRSTNDEGYGLIRVEGRLTYVHHVVHDAVNGPPPTGWVRDHLCHDPDWCPPGPRCPHRRCTAERHLLPVPAATNTLRGGSANALNARKTHCEPHGHPLSGPNLYIHPQRGTRECRRCRLIASLEHAARARARLARELEDGGQLTLAL
jgi:hypothetical protein